MVKTANDHPDSYQGDKSKECDFTFQDYDRRLDNFDKILLMGAYFIISDDLLDIYLFSFYRVES